MSLPSSSTAAFAAAAGAPPTPPQSPKPWRVRVSATSRRTCNPIRQLVDGLQLEPNPEKPIIALSIGDPTLFGNFKPPSEAVAAVQKSVESGCFNGYAPTTGYRDAREAVAEYTSCEGDPVSYEDVVLCSGCSSALETCIAALADPGQNILIPRPGFPLYRTLARSMNIEVRFYDTLPDRAWEVDLNSLEKLVDENTAFLIINNPSNPCGSVWSRSHILQVLELAHRKRIPIVADEIYEHLVFPGEKFYSFASLSTDVPILSCGGLTKRFMVPGWRMGWVIVHDRKGAFGPEMRNALNALSQRFIGSNTLVQGALRTILEETPQKYYEDCISSLAENALLVYTLLSQVRGLKPVIPQGAMYMMVRLDLHLFPGIQDECQFVERLMAEESVFCLPGKCFDFPGYMRLVLTPPPASLEEACKRIAEFCSRHIVLSSSKRAIPSSSASVSLAYAKGTPLTATGHCVNPT